MDNHGLKNIMQVPKLKKIVISKGVGVAVADKKLIDHALMKLHLSLVKKQLQQNLKKIFLISN